MSKKKRPNKIVVETRRDDILPQVSEPKANVSAPNSNKNRNIIIFGILALLIGGLAVWFYRQKPNPTNNKNVGIVTNCQKLPPFLASLGTKNPSLSTSEKSHAGLWLIDGARKYQHPSWKNAGFLAPIERDKDGNIFVAPAPFINILQNPPEQQNAVWRVDGATQEMTKFVELPNDAQLTANNAYGTLDLTYDCETEKLYVSSVYGSQIDKEVGTIYAIDTKTKSVSPVLEKIDAFGLGIFKTVGGKRLFYGLARKSELWSIALDDKGKPFGTSRKELSIKDLGKRGDDRPRKLTFTPNGEMILSGIEFDFNLVAPTEKPETIYRFQYDAEKDSWVFIPPPPQIVR